MLKRMRLNLGGFLAVVLCIGFIFQLIFVSHIAKSESNVVEMNPTVTNIIQKTADSWIDTSESRALLTVLLAADYLMENPNGIKPSIVDTSWVGKSGFMLVVVLYSQERGKLITIMYNPTIEQAYYDILSSGVLNDAAIERVIGKTCEDGFYVNDFEDLRYAANQLNEILNE